MTRYREVWIVDAIEDINDLIDLCVVGHLQAANKDIIVTALMGFIQPRLKEICEKLADDATEDREIKPKKCGGKTH